MAEQPSVWGRLLALIEGEVSAETLEAYRRAGRAVYDLLEEVEEQRLEAKIGGVHPWSAGPATQALFLSAWNAFALQTLGDQLLDADYRANPSTVGYVPAVTAEQILACYQQVESWLSRAHEARSNPAYQLDVILPTDLPPWAEVEPCPRAHLEAMLAAAGSLRSHAEAALATFEDITSPADRRSSIQRVQQLLAEANSKAQYAERLWAPDTPQPLHEQIERLAKEALERYYHLGQLLAMPELVEHYGQRGGPPTSSSTPTVATLPAPGESGFDPWALTDPRTRADWKRDREAREAIDALWAYDPDPRRTLAVQAAIDSALARGDIGYATTRTGQSLGHYYCCPWSAVYLAKRPVTIGGSKILPLQQFTFDVSAEEMGEGEPFKREIVVANFQPTTRVDYCNPREGGHHDD